MDLDGEEHPKKAVFFFLNPSLTVVGYNAALQGGIINQPRNVSKNDYHIATDSISRLIGKVQFGIKYEGKKIAASLSQVIQTAEFATVKHHEWGNISVSFRM